MTDKRTPFWYTMQTDRAVVTRIGNRTIIAELTQSSGCSTSGCASCGVCSGGEKPPPARALLPRRLFPGIKQGDHIIVTRAIINPALAAITVFGIPLGCAVAAAALAPLLGFAAESGRGALLVIGALAGGFGLVMILDRLFTDAVPPSCTPFSGN